MVWIIVGSVLSASSTGILAVPPIDVIIDCGPWFLGALGVWIVIDGLFLIERESIEATESTLDHSAVQGEGDGEPTPSRNKTDPYA